MKWDKDRIYEQILGAWLGRAAGCLLGKPVEGWPKARIDKYLKDKKIEILDDYLPFDEKILPGVHKVSTKGNIKFMPRDDDMDYVIIGLLALENRGIKTSPRTIAHTWVDRLPLILCIPQRNAHTEILRTQFGHPCPRLIEIHLGSGLEHK